jgi:hypothetical protein
VGADVLGQFAGLDHLVRLVELVQATAVGLEHGDAAGLDGCLVLAAVLHLAIDLVALHQFLEKRLTTEVELERRAGHADVADVVVGADVMGQVDGEPGVTPGRAEANLLSLQQHDLLVGKFSASWRAAARPVKPAPTTTQRAVLWPLCGALMRRPLLR